MSQLNTGVPSTYYNLDIKGIYEEFPIDNEDDTVYVDGTLVQAGNNNGYILHLTHINGEFTAHREDGPACINANGESWFFHEGRNYTIEDFPVDDMTKTLWLLKYEFNGRDDYVTYNGVK